MVLASHVMFISMILSPSPYQWNTQAADGQFRNPASNAKLASLLEKSGVDFKFTKFEDGMSHFFAN